MKCPKCNYAYVKAIGKKRIKKVVNPTAKIEKQIKKISWTKAKKYYCKNCGEFEL